MSRRFLHRLPLLLIVLPITCPCHGQAEPLSRPPAQLTAPEIEFTPVSILPSPHRDSYHGIFRYINHGGKLLKVSSQSEPAGNRIIAAFPGFDMLKDGAWSSITVGYCGLHLDDFPLNPGTTYELEIPLHHFDEQPTPLTGRASLELIDASGRPVTVRSGPFVLDWKTDRAAGMFAAARKANFADARRSFARAGFREDLIAGDDFCQRLVRQMMDRAAPPEHPEMVPFEGALDITPDMENNGMVRIDFSSTRRTGSHDTYHGWFYLNPEKFSPGWLRQARGKLVTTRDWGEGFKMELDEHHAWTKETALYLAVNHVPVPKPDGLTEKHARAAFIRMLDVLQEWCPEKETIPGK